MREYELYLLNERKLTPESINPFVTAVKFLYLVTLEMPWGNGVFPRVRRPGKLPVVLSQEELAVFFDYIPTLRYRAAFMICYGAGLRIPETVWLKVSDIESQRMLIRVEQGKGRKDRYAMLSPRLRRVLRVYWRTTRPQKWLFPGIKKDKPLSLSAIIRKRSFLNFEPGIAASSAPQAQSLSDHPGCKTTSLCPKSMAQFQRAQYRS